MGNHCFKAPDVQCGVDSCGGWGCMCEAPVPQFYNTSFSPADYTFTCTCQPRDSMLLAFSVFGVAIVLVMALSLAARRFFLRLNTVRLLVGLVVTFMLSGVILFAFGFAPYDRAEHLTDPFDGCSGSAPFVNENNALPSTDCDASHCSYPAPKYILLIFGVFTAMLLPGYGGESITAYDCLHQYQCACIPNTPSDSHGTCGALLSSPARLAGNPVFSVIVC